MALSDLISQLQQNALVSEQRRAASQKALSSAMAQAQQAQAAAPVASGWGGNTSGGGGGGNNKPAPTIAGSSSSATIPTGKIDPYAGMKTMKFNGISYQVNATAAKRFQGFLKDLRGAGYTPSSIGGYANRNIAGSSTKSLHSYGLAIDIDPGKNPVTWNGKNQTALPKGVGRLARRHGLVWGGNWNGSKKDTMHFSVPYFGTK